MIIFTALIELSWGILQSLIGFSLFLKYRKYKHEIYKGSVLTYIPDDFGGISLGLFIFVNGTKNEQWIQSTRAHEYGHTFQSLLLGPLYLFVIGLPSMYWCNNKKMIVKRKNCKISYYDFYTERFANFFGTRFGRKNDKKALKEEIIGGR